MYEDAGGRLTEETGFGVDPLDGRTEDKSLRDERFWREIELPPVGGRQNLANQLVNHNYVPFQYAVLRFIELGAAQ